MQSFRYAFRGLVRRPWSAAVGVLALVLRDALTLLFGVGARDPATFVLAPAILLAAELLGCLAPAFRAMRVDPATALRSE